MSTHTLLVVATIAACVGALAAWQAANALVSLTNELRALREDLREVLGHLGGPLYKIAEPLEELWERYDALTYAKSGPLEVRAKEERHRKGEALERETTAYNAISEAMEHYTNQSEAAKREACVRVARIANRLRGEGPLAELERQELLEVAAAETDLPLEEVVRMADELAQTEPAPKAEGE